VPKLYYRRSIAILFFFAKKVYSYTGHVDADMHAGTYSYGVEMDMEAWICRNMRQVPTSFIHVNGNG
jgi:hypothetical protein